MSCEKQISVSFSSPPDRDFLVADIFVGNEQIAELNRETGNLELEIYPARNGECWAVSFEELMESLQAASTGLTARLNGVEECLTQKQE